MGRDGYRHVATDGSGTTGDAPGGWAAVFDDGTEISGGAPLATNNQMELQAVIEALRAIPEPSKVRVFCDSQYVVHGITKWIGGWKRKGWKKIKNKDRWLVLEDECRRHFQVEMVWVRGHNGHQQNERADELAGEARLAVRST